MSATTWWDTEDWPFVATVEWPNSLGRLLRHKGSFRVWPAKSEAWSCGCRSCLAESPPLLDVALDRDVWVEILVSQGWHPHFEEWDFFNGRTGGFATGPVRPRSYGADLSGAIESKGA